MSAESFDQRIEKIEQLVVRLVHEHERLKDEIARLKKEKEELNTLLTSKDEEINYFQNQEKITKIVSSVTDGTPAQTDLKLLINEYIREIDKCIAHLSE